ncbi:MAG: hypothetical protein JWM27_2916 [Gemmatimonadetes bacterium]|nr:hypothetical protein [Gemmatimonadota bacterium]
MAQLTLEGDEARLLASALRSYLSELHTEITATDSMDMRDELKRQEGVLNGVLQRLDPASEP